MRFVDEYRDAAGVQRLVREIAARATRPWTLMEVCGGQTHTLVRTGLERMLPDTVTLVHGPGCPVCVTPLALIDRACAIARLPGVTFTSFGDMLRVPGSDGDLLAAKAAGADVRIVYSPLDALRLAERLPQREVVFFAVGFETTAPANAMAVWLAARRGVRNFSILGSHARVPPVLEALVEGGASVQAFLAAGHVCAVMGWEEYEPLAARHRMPIVVTGFEPLDLAEGILAAVTALEQGRHGVENAYARAVTRDGNVPARLLIDEVFEGCDREWRGLGTIAASGWRLRPEFAAWDAERRFAIDAIPPHESAACRAGDVLRGRLRPDRCPAFGTACTPEHPLGAPMVSAEGACAAYVHAAEPA